MKLALNKERFQGDGRTLIGNLIERLEIYRATADAQNGIPFVSSLTSVDGKYVHWRSIVALHERPRPLFIQPNTFISGTRVEIREYEAMPEGLIQSWVEREIP